MPPTIFIPHIPRQTKLVDIKENEKFLPNVNCVPFPQIRGEYVANDAVIVETVYDNGLAAVRFQFKSEVGGLFGTTNPLKETCQAAERFFPGRYPTCQTATDYFAGYALYVNELGAVYAKPTPVSVDGTESAHDESRLFQVDELERVQLLMASALSCTADQGAGDPTLQALAEDLMAASLITYGAPLPKPDKVESQTYAAERANADDYYTCAFCPIPGVWD